MNELVGVMIVAVLGFSIGGIVGLVKAVGFFPFAWYGLAIAVLVVLGGCLCSILD